MTRRTLSTALSILALIAGCGPSATTTGELRFDIAFRAATDDGDALAGVALRLGDRLLGLTDSSGGLSVSLNAPEGQVLAVTVTCPTGFASPDTVPPLRLAHSRLVAEQPGKRPPISFPATCIRESRDVVVLVHADRGDALPVLVDGRPVATTDANGVAHILLEFARDVRSFEVRLDTTERHDFKPASPSRTFELTGRDAIVLFNQPMSIAPKVVVRRAEAARHIPYRID
jgi:hypothetical protein